MNITYSICTVSTPSMPVGYIVTHVGSLPSPPLLPCDGRPLSKTVYGELFNVIGTSFGGTSSTFNLPNCGAYSESSCKMCKQPRYTHVPEDEHPFCNSTLDYLEWKYDNVR